MRTRLHTPITTAGWRTLIWTATIGVSCGLVALLLLLDSKIAIFETAVNPTTNADILALPPFPIGVHPTTKQITEQPELSAYVTTSIASNHTPSDIERGWFDRAIAHLSDLTWYQHLASPHTRILVVQSGDRLEQVAERFAKILLWDDTARSIFINRLTDEAPVSTDGKLYPGRYIVSAAADPESVAIMITERFNAEIRTRYTADIEAVVPLSDTLIIASLIEREAYDFTDMRFISGVIWNRLFTDMRLQIDATLQYARGAEAAAAGGRWWPVPRPEDKFLDSPFNTYQHAGLPPAPIANPSIEAIIAALNPRETDCLFYYHTHDGTFYCNATYEAHLTGIEKHLKAPTE